MKILTSQIKRVTVLRKALGPENFQDFSEIGPRSKIILLTKAPLLKTYAFSIVKRADLLFGE